MMRAVLSKEIRSGVSPALAFFGMTTTSTGMLVAVATLEFHGHVQTEAKRAGWHGIELGLWWERIVLTGRLEGSNGPEVRRALQDSHKLYERLRPRVREGVKKPLKR